MAREIYVQEERVKDKTTKEQETELIKSIIKAKIELENSNRNFEYAEGELIDYYTYQIKANQSKLDYLVKKAKNNKIMLDMIHAIQIELLEEDVS